MHILRAPSLNPNDTVVRVLQWLKEPCTFVRAGETVCTIETTKAVFDVEAEADGYLLPLVKEGHNVEVGAPLAALTPEPTDGVPAEVLSVAAAVPAADTRRFTRKAEIAARRLGVDLAGLAALRPDGRITEADVEAAARAAFAVGAEQTSGDLVDDTYPTGRAERVLIVGSGRAAVQLIDALHRRADQRAVAIVDDNRAPGATIMGVPIIGPAALAAELAADGKIDAAIVAFGTPDARSRLQAELGAGGVRFTNVIDPHAIISANVQIGSGNFISAGTRIGPCATLADGNFISSMCSLEHHNVVGSYCHFGPAVVTSGSVRIGDHVLFGTGIHIEPEISIGDGCVVASGVTVTQSVPAHSSVKAVGAPIVRPR